MVARSIREVLPHAQVAFGSLNGSMAERNLDLLQCGAAAVSELREAAACIVRRQLNSDAIRRNQ